MFYTFDQNNSGGSFVRNNRLAEYVIIEADSAKEANSRAEDIGIYFGGEDDCPCCGDRWYEANDCNADNEPSIHGVPVGKVTASFYRSVAVIHYTNGVVDTVVFPSEKSKKKAKKKKKKK